MTCWWIAGITSGIDRATDFLTRSILGVPMRSRNGNQVIGVLEAVNKRNLPWTPDDINYLSIVAVAGGGRHRRRADGRRAAKSQRRTQPAR